MVAKRSVLLRIEHLEQCGGRVAPEIHPELVDLVQHEDRVLGPGAAEALDDLPWQRADVRPAVTADLRFVTHAAERDPVELAPERPRDGLPQRRLADAGRADEAQDRILPRRADLLHREIFQDAVLDLLEALVVLVEDRVGLGDVHAVRRFLLPRHRHEPVDVGARDGVFGRRRRHLRETIELARRLGARLLRHARGVDLLTERVDLLRALVALAELLLNRLHLLAQIVVALGLRHLGMHFRLDLRPELQDLGLLGEGGHEALQALGDAERLEQPLPQRHRQRRKRRGDQIGERARALGGADDARELVRQRR